MTRLIDSAIAALRGVSPDRQDEIALAVLALADERAIYSLSAEERADIADADAEVDHGEIATDAEVRDLWAKYGL